MIEKDKYLKLQKINKKVIHIVLIFEPVINDVKNINTIGKKFIKIKNNNFLSLKSTLNLIFLIINQFKNKNSTNIPICLNKNNWIFNMIDGIRAF